jgi:hypothetical protein
MGVGWPRPLHRKLVAAVVDQRCRGGQPPGLIGEFRELRPIDPIEVNHHPAEPAGGELHFKNIWPFSDQSELFGDKLLESDGAGSGPEVSERVAMDLEGRIARGLEALHALQLLDELQKIYDLRSHALISSLPDPATSARLAL